jgi:hypothetical protein
MNRPQPAPWATLALRLAADTNALEFAFRRGALRLYADPPIKPASRGLLQPGSAAFMINGARSVIASLRWDGTTPPESP